MKIDRTLKEFSESYNTEAIKSITTLSSDIVAKSSKFNGFNIQEGFDNFIEYLNGYVAYKINEASSSNEEHRKSYSNDVIVEKSKHFIDNGLFQECLLPYSESESFVSSYILGVKNIINAVENGKKVLMENMVDNESVGSIDNITDAFIEKVDSLFTPTMNKILMASGYSTRLDLSNYGRKKEDTYFL